MLKKLESRVKKNKRVSMGLYSNLVAGVVTGTSIGAVFPNFKSFLAEGWIFSWLINIILISIMLFLFYKIGRWAIRLVIKDHTEDEGFNKNFVTGTFSSVYVSILLTIHSPLGKGILICLSVGALLVLLYLYTRPKR